MLGFLGLLGGFWGVTRGQRKLGWWAIGISLAGIAAAIWVQTKDVESLDEIVTAGLIAATLRFATPLAFAATAGSSPSGPASSTSGSRG